MGAAVSAGLSQHGTTVIGVTVNLSSASAPGTEMVRDTIITAACAAAYAVSDRGAGPRATGERLIECLGVLAAAHPVGGAPSMAEFRRLLSEPVRNLMPAGTDAGQTGDLILLDRAGRLHDEAADVWREHLIPAAAFEQRWSLPRLRAEQEERRLYQELRALGQDGYVRARELLVTRPAGDVRALRRAWDDLWPRLGDYHPVADLGQVAVSGWWFPCPACRWPMRAEEATGGVWRVSCEADAARGVSYTARPEDWRGEPVLAPAGRHAPRVTGQHASADHFAVSRAVWRYITLPGVLEIGLRDYALKLGADVTLWPHLDEYDLRITIGGRTWRIDVKAWASPVALARALLAADRPREHLHIVLPDHQTPACPAISDVLRPRNMTVTTMGRMKATLRAAGREAR
jgi:REase associating with pPIWI_RE